MRAWEHMISRGLHYGHGLHRFEHAVLRYSQLIIFVLGMAAVAYLYLVMQDMLANYLLGLELTPQAPTAE
jgi:hypothetical protein